MTLTELQPTKANPLKTFSTDTIGRSKSVVLFAQYLSRIDSGFSIAIDSSWGGGKTFFVKQTKMVLDSFNPFSPNSLVDAESEQLKQQAEKYFPNVSEALTSTSHVSVYYDAWANDNSSDPLLSLVYEIVRNVNSDFDSLKQTDIPKLSAAIFDFFTGKNAKDILEIFRGDNPLDVICQEKTLQTLIDDFLREIIKERGNRLVVFVDELDRCNPNYAVRLLERVKHYFSNENVTFVFSINSDALQRTISKFYGVRFDSSRYLDRFFDLSIALPPVNMALFYKHLGLQTWGTDIDIVSFHIVTKYGFSMREAIRFNKAVIVGTKHIDATTYALMYCLTFILPVAAALRIIDQAQFLSFISGRDGSPFYDLIQQLEEDSGLSESYDRWLLDYTESYNVTDNPKIKTVSRSDKLRDVYDALFSRRLKNGRIETVRIGDLRFDDQMRSQFFARLGALSENADYTGNT